MPTVSWALTRTPARITGQAIGSRICHSIRKEPTPMPRAASSTAGSAPWRPTIALRTIGSIA